MAGHAFLSYGTPDLAGVKALAGELETAGLACWYAARDIPKGHPWPQRVTEALQVASVVVLYLSKASNQSREVHREVAFANSENLPVLCLRTEDVHLDPSLKFLLAIANWMDVIAGGVEAHHARILAAVRRLVDERAAAGSAVAPAPQAKDHMSPAQNVLERIAADIRCLQDRALLLAAVMAEQPNVLVASDAANQTLIRVAEAYNRDVPPLVRRLDAYGGMVHRYWGPDMTQRFEDLRQRIERDIYRGSVFELNDERTILNAHRAARSLPPELEHQVAQALGRKTARVREEVARLTDAWASLQAAMRQAL